MTAISHALIGASIAAKVSSPLAAGSIAFGTHFLCDIVPHWDFGTNWRLRPKIVTGALAIAETLIALIGGYFLFTSLVPNQMTLAIAIVASLLPDWLEAPYYIFPKAPRIFYHLYKIQSRLHSRMQAPAGIYTQIIVVGLFLIIGFVL